MAKKKNTDEGFPYFKFFISKWTTGNIQHCSLSAQGLFINLCVLYWGQRGDMYLSKAQKRFNRKSKQFEELLNEDVIKLNGDKIEITFLDEQLEELGIVSEKNREAANARWNAIKSDATASLPQCQTDANAMPEEKRREEKKRVRGESKPLRAFDIPFDEGSDVFEAWTDWENYRREIKKKLTESTAKRQLNFLSGRAGPEIIAIIEQSIKNGWTGLFELKNNGTTRTIKNDRTEFNNNELALIQQYANGTTG